LFDDQSWGADTAFVITDFASGMIDRLVSLNQGNYPIFLLDHHAIVGKPDSSITLVNPRTFGLSSRSASASMVCALFALACSPINEDLVSLGVIGAVGDGFISAEQTFEFPSSVIFERALASGCVQRNPDSLQLMWTPNVEVRKVVKYLDALGSWNYFSGGTDIAVKCLGSQFRVPSSIVADKALTDFDSGLADAMFNIGIKRCGEISWFSLPEKFCEVGVKTVGLLCERLCTEEEAGQSNNTQPRLAYLAGFQPLSPNIPGLGAVLKPGVKVSMRLGVSIRDRVGRGELPGIDVILPSAVDKFNGFVDACHPHAGAATIPPGKELALIEELDRALQSI
jgi:hypothetical protein